VRGVRIEYYTALAFDAQGHPCFTVRKRTFTPIGIDTERVTHQTWETKEEAESFICDLYCGHLPEANYA
jgi:hypothetical protein